MELSGTFKLTARNLKREAAVYRMLVEDKRTPKIAKIFLGQAAGYFFLPFDIIPDLFPVIGHPDDAIIIPAVVYLELKMIPKELIEECRQNYKNNLLVLP